MPTIRVPQCHIYRVLEYLQCSAFISGWALSKKVLLSFKLFCFLVERHQTHLRKTHLPGTLPLLPLVNYTAPVHFCLCILHQFRKQLSQYPKWKDRRFSSCAVFWLEQSYHFLDSFFLFSEWVSSENKSGSTMNLSFWSWKHRLFPLPCEDHDQRWALVDSSVVVYSDSVYHVCAKTPFPQACFPFCVPPFS